MVHDRPSWELLSTCVHCGLCLNHCPTYKVLGMEMDSPRGRIYQMLQVNEGRMELGEMFVTHIDRCLGCVACEIACPSAEVADVDGDPWRELVLDTRGELPLKRPIAEAGGRTGIREIRRRLVAEVDIRDGSTVAVRKRVG